jgi:hypothetical protein
MAYVAVIVTGAPAALAVFAFGVLTLATAMGSWLGFKRLQQ